MFTLHLEGLRCVTAQEADGDEIYLMVDERQVWSVGTRRMTDQPADAEQISEVDFVNGRWRTLNGWESFPNFEAGEFVIPVQGEAARIELRERDLLLGDDVIGGANVMPEDAGRGQIQLAFTAEGAHYMLMYRVSAEG